MASRLVDDLHQIPNIVGSLGLAIAEAQKHFDENYLRGLERLAVIAQAFLKKDGTAEGPVSDDFMRHLVETASPTRYQFTETSIMVKLDLSESKDFSASGGVGFGFAGAVVNAAFSFGYSQDYRAGAEVRTTLHAVLPQNNKAAFDALLDNAKNLRNAVLELPKASELDGRVIQAMTDAATRINAKPAEIKVPVPKEE